MSLIFEAEGSVVSYYNKGCYKENIRNRALPELILYVRGEIDWSNWKTFLPGLVCDCAKKSKELGFKYFGIQFYGECDRFKKCSEVAWDFSKFVEFANNLTIS